MNIRQIIKEEIRRISNMFEAGPTRGFTKAAEAMYDAELQQQQLRKKFVAEKNPKKKEKLKQAIILMHKKVQKLQSAFNAVLRDEPIDLEMEVAEAIHEAKMTKKHAALAIKQLKPIKSVENVVPKGDVLFVAYNNYKERSKIIKQLEKLYQYDSDGRSTNAPRIVGVAGYNWIAFVTRH